jgi:fructan beta-fructosidase
MPGYFECTNLFELPVDGDKGDTRWVVFAADAKYAVGSFDGKVFTPEHRGKHQVHYGPYYASQVFDNAPDGRVIQIGWVRVQAPGPYNQHFSFPHRLTLHKTEDGIRMFAKPVREIERLRKKTNRLRPQDINREIALPVTSDLLDVRFTFEVGDTDRVTLNIPGRKVEYDARGQKLNGAPLKPVEGKISVQVLCDRSLTEIAGNDGRVFITAKGPPKQDVGSISVTANGGTAKLISLEAHELKSIWD